MNDYGQEFMQAWERTLRFGLALPPIRLLVRKDCIDLAKALPVIVDYFNRHSGEGLVGRPWPFTTCCCRRSATHSAAAPPVDDRLD